MRISYRKRKLNDNEFDLRGKHKKRKKNDALPFYIELDDTSCKNCKGTNFVYNPDSTEVCTGCGVCRTQLHVKDVSYALDNSTGLRRIQQDDAFSSYKNKSAAYRRCFHFAERCKLWLNVEPRICKTHLQLYLDEFENSVDYKNTRYDYKSIHKVEIQKLSKAIEKRTKIKVDKKYTERWLQIKSAIIQEFYDSEWRPDLPEVSIVNRMYKAFILMDQVYDKLKCGTRKNIIHLDSLFLQLLYMEGIDLYNRYKWYFKQLKGCKCNIKAVSHIYLLLHALHTSNSCYDMMCEDRYAKLFPSDYFIFKPVLLRPKDKTYLKKKNLSIYDKDLINKLK